MPFWKMNGAGNEIIVADMRGISGTIAPQAALALDAGNGTKFDQIMELHDPSDEAHDADIRILNSDGSEAEACGNGTRCVVAYLHRENEKQNWLFRTRHGLLKSVFRTMDQITVDMGVPKFGWEDIPLEEEFHDTTGIELQVGPIDDPVLHTPSVASMGNPHCIFWAPEDVWSYELDRFGPLLENHPMFPQRCNISIANVPARDAIVLRTWERGAGITQACGSAACASLVCAVRKDFTDRKATVKLPGGELLIEWADNQHVHMTGPAEFEFAGVLDPATGEFDREAS